MGCPKDPGPPPAAATFHPANRREDRPPGRRRSASAGWSLGGRALPGGELLGGPWEGGRPKAWRGHGEGRPRSLRSPSIGGERGGREGQQGRGGDRGKGHGKTGTGPWADPEKQTPRRAGQDPGWTPPRSRSRARGPPRGLHGAQTRGVRRSRVPTEPRLRRSKARRHGARGDPPLALPLPPRGPHPLHPLVPPTHWPGG